MKRTGGRDLPSARRTLADDSKELDVLQREFNLKQVQFYSNPNVALREQYSRKDLDDTQAQINTKKQDVDKDNQAIQRPARELRTSGGEPGWANEDANRRRRSGRNRDASQLGQELHQSFADCKLALLPRTQRSTGAGARSTDRRRSRILSAIKADCRTAARVCPASPADHPTVHSSHTRPCVSARFHAKP